MVGIRSALTMVVLLLLGAASLAADPPKMRPYSGIGVVRFAASADTPQESLILYEEPGIFRVGEYNHSKATGNEWVVGKTSETLLLIVMARKGEWLRVTYDDAGREAWVKPQRSSAYQPWDQFLKTQTCHLLPGVRKPFYQLYRQPSRDPLVMLTPKQVFRILKVDGDWAMVVVDQTSIGWLRWRDEDGRLVLGFGR